MGKNATIHSMRGQFKSFLRAVDILNLLEERIVLSAARISDSLGIPRSTAYKYLAVMRACRLVDYEGDVERYRLGMRLFELGAAVQHQLTIDRVARPFMEELSDHIDETVGLNILDGNHTVYLERVDTRNRDGIVFFLRKGIRRPLHAGAAGKILLAYQPEDRIERFLKEQKLVPYTENTITDPDELRKQLKTIRKKGYAFSKEEINRGVMAFAAPVFGHDGKIAAGLVVAAPIQRIVGRKREEIPKWIVTYSKRISQKLKSGTEH